MRTQWFTATGALHCANGFGIGDWFGKIVADSLSQDTLALIPCAIAGVDIDFFRKGVTSTRRKEFTIPPDNHWDGAYPWMVERLKLALQKGENHQRFKSRFGKPQTVDFFATFSICRKRLNQLIRWWA